MLGIEQAAIRNIDQRFVRHANAVTQAEIRRLSRPDELLPPDHDVVETVQRELRRLARPRRRTPPPRTGAPDRG